MGINSSMNKLDTVSRRLEYLSEKTPEKDLFVFYNGSDRHPITARELFQLAGKFASRLRQYGFKKNDVIINSLPNSPERVVTEIGIMFAGCVSLNGMILSADGADFIQCARTAKADGIILRPDDVSAAWRLLGDHISEGISGDVAQLQYEQIPHMKKAILVTRNDGNLLLERLRTSDDPVLFEPMAENDTMIVMTTSGTTGFSKLVPRTQAQVITMWESLVETTQGTTDADDVVHYNDNSLGWQGGYPYITYCNGDTRVLQDRFQPQAVTTDGQTMWEALCREKCTSALIMSRDLLNILTHVEASGGSSYRMKTLVCGGRPLRKSMLERVCCLTEKIRVGYGSTETGSIAWANIANNAELKDSMAGKPLPNIEVRIVNDQGKVVQSREIGTICVKGPTLFSGYYSRPPLDSAAAKDLFTEDGFFDTNDKGFFDNEGFLYVLGRKNDVIMYNGLQVYPAWLEKLIFTHPDVEETCVVPVSSMGMFHKICACVKVHRGRSLSEEAVKSFCETVFLTDDDNEITPIPDFFLLTDSFPKTPSGKTNRKELKRMAEDKFGTIRE